MKKPAIIIIFVLVLLVVLVMASQSLLPLFQKGKPSTQTPNVPIIGQSKDNTTVPKTTVVASGLEVPWALAFLPDNSLLITERPGRVRMITNDGKKKPEPLLTLDVAQKIQGEGGLHGIVPHPQYASNKYIYIYYTYENTGNGSLNRVARYTLENEKLVDEKIIVENIPGALFHDGGRIKFGPDNFLYITTGDAQDPSRAQDVSSLAGKVLRVTDNGDPAPGNPFGTRIYSYGHRNPQGIAWDENGNLWQTEHGRSNPTGYDELNLIKSGKNYGWPDIEGDETKIGTESPKKHSGTGTWAPGGAAFINNSLFFVGLRGQTLYEAKIENEQVTELKTHLVEEYGRLRDVIAGPDGMIYVTTSNRDGRGFPKNGDDKILRINPEKL